MWKFSKGSCFTRNGESSCFQRKKDVLLSTPKRQITLSRLIHYIIFGIPHIRHQKSKTKFKTSALAFEKLENLRMNSLKIVITWEYRSESWPSVIKAAGASYLVPLIMSWMKERTTHKATWSKVFSFSSEAKSNNWLRFTTIDFEVKNWCRVSRCMRYTKYYHLNS